MAKIATDRTTIDLFAHEKRPGRPRTNPLPREEQLKLNKIKLMTENNSNSDNPHPEQEIIVPKKSKSEDKEKKPSAFVTWLKYTNKWLRLITIILTTVLFLTVIISLARSTCKPLISVLSP